MRSTRTILCLMFSVLPAAAQLMAKSEPPMRPQVMESYGKLPLTFEANQGQTDQRVKFLARGPGYGLFLTQDSAVLSLHQEKANAVLRMRLLGANAHATVAGTDGLPGKSNYFTGSDPSQWRTNVPTYAAVKYAGVYPGIDLVYHGDQRLLEYDFVLAPGADPKAIDLRFQGAQKLSVNAAGDLVISVGGSEVIEHAPVVYQDIDSQRLTVTGRYVLRGRSRVGFSLGAYDRSQPLVIDPSLVYSTYLGGSGDDTGYRIAVDVAGNAYVTGWTTSSNFPTTPGAFQVPFGGGGCGQFGCYRDAYVSKLNATGSALVYSTYIGGSNDEQGWGIAVDASGSAYVTGITLSSDFPTTPGPFQSTTGTAFVTKLNPAGSALVYSIILPGSGGYDGDIAVDAAGSAYITGGANSSSFLTTPGAFRTTFGAQPSYAFVTKLNAAGSALIYSTLLGDGQGRGIALDASGNAYITGLTGLGDFPSTPGAFKTSLSVGMNGFITKLNSIGSALVYSTFLGGWSFEIYGIAVDPWGNAYVTGHTSTNSTFPITPGAFQTTSGGSDRDAFVTKLNSTGSALVYSTYLGSDDFGLGITVDAIGNAYVTGVAGANFPTTADAIQTTASYAGFLTKLNATGSALIYSTYLGDACTGSAVDASGNVYVTGRANSADLPTTMGAFQTTLAGGNNKFAAFVTKLSLGTSVPGPVTSAILAGPSGNNGWYLGAVTVTLSASDPDTPVSATYYQVDGGAEQRYFGSFLISSDGVHQLLFYSVDTAGYQEPPHGQMIQIDSTRPVSHVAALPGTASSPNFSVQWSGTDATSGLRNYSLYVSDNGGPFTPWLNQTTATQSWFVGSLGHTYGFYSIAQDIAGNQEIKTAADTATYVPQMPGDVNGDGKIDCADITIVKASFGKRTGQPGFDPRADVNGDGVVDVRDLAIVSQKLIPGTHCP